MVRVLQLALLVGGALQEHPDFIGEEIWIAAGPERRRLLLASEGGQQPAPCSPLIRLQRRGELRDRVGLEVAGLVERLQMGDEMVFVSRRQQGAEQQDVRHGRAHRLDRRVERVDDRDVCECLLPDDAFDDGGLAEVRLDRQDEGLRH